MPSCHACTCTEQLLHIHTCICITEKLLVEYDNGEMETVTISHTEPGEGFNPPVIGESVCVKSRGGKYSALIRD